MYQIWIKPKNLGHCLKLVLTCVVYNEFHIDNCGKEKDMCNSGGEFHEKILHLNCWCSLTLLLLCIKKLFLQDHQNSSLRSHRWSSVERPLKAMWWNVVLRMFPLLLIINFSSVLLRFNQLGKCAFLWCAFVSLIDILFNVSKAKD